jgi:hypothetical protein
MLNVYLTGHGILSHFWNDPQGLITWLDSTPGPFVYYIAALSSSAKNKFFKLRDVPIWYSGLQEKINNGTVHLVSYLGTTDLERLAKIKEIADVFMFDLMDLNLSSETMQSVSTEFILRSTEATNRLVNLLIADSVFSELDAFRLGIETSQYKRWQSLGLTDPPTLADINELNLYT